MKCADPNETESLDDMMANMNKNDFASQSEDYAAALDIHGYNYMHFRYEEDTKRFPNRIFVGTESMAMEMADIWKAVRKNPAILGDFTWTGMDHIGECGCGKIDYDNTPSLLFGTYPWILSYSGDIDLIGNRRPQSYYREILWGTYTKPYIAVERPERYGQKPVTTGNNRMELV